MRIYQEVVRTDATESNKKVSDYPTVEIVYPLEIISTFPQPCAKCGNNPINGGSGICACTLNIPIIGTGGTAL